MKRSKIEKKLAEIWNAGPYDKIVYRNGGSEKGWTMYPMGEREIFMGENSTIAIEKGKELREYCEAREIDF